jgi:hypothetical protein
MEATYNIFIGNASDINEHLPVLKSYAEQCEHVTEFGVRDIVSTWGLLAGKPKKLISYDIKLPGGDVYAVRAVASAVGVKWEFVLGSTLEVEIVETDLLFIDSLHTYEQLKAELERHSEKVKKWIILHDTVAYGTVGENGDKGLWPAVEEFVVAGKWRVLERRTNNNGLTVLERVGWNPVKE